jgi:antitoxin Phd
MVTLRGKDAAVLVPVGEWERLRDGRRRSIKDLLLADEPKVDLPELDRSQLRLRPVDLNG